MTIIEFEKILMTMLLSGDDPILKGLREQYERCTVESREFTGAGFYTNFVVDFKQNPVAGGKSFQLGDVNGNIKGILDALGFVVFIKDGFLSFLEGYSNLVDFWPEDYSGIELTYDSGLNRDIGKLVQTWK
ncbi:MAG: hypothetical protein ACM3UZ_12745 [Acidobacteriota bacterium]